ncbi:MAG TPA: hypothetical protein VJL54_09015 [Nitrososphaera sp.]|nr:hypothetical protein [Nitrososphaera sp.]
MADARSILVTQLKSYKLCQDCLNRHGSRQRPAAPCHICRGLMLEKESIVRKIRSASKGYQFETFLIGAVLPTQIYEREDAMRARLKIMGRESIKSQLTREVGLRFAKTMRKRVDYFNPDLMISIVIDKENNIDVSAKSRPVTFRGAYKKRAGGLPQKQQRCGSCEGKGCADCALTGLSGYESIEGTIARALVNRTRGRTPRFSWLGSEDRNSLVLGKGRPFYVRVYDPHRRKFQKIAIREKAISAMLYPVQDSAIHHDGIRVKTRIVVRCEGPVENKVLAKTKTLAGAQVRFEGRSRIATKSIYSAVPRRVNDRSFSLTIVADGGLMIKQFVGGEEFMKPNISEIIGQKCECITFDILDVAVTGTIHPRQRISAVAEVGSKAG